MRVYVAQQMRLSTTSSQETLFKYHHSEHLFANICGLYRARFFTAKITINAVSTAGLTLKTRTCRLRKLSAANIC